MLLSGQERTHCYAVVSNSYISLSPFNHVCTIATHTRPLRHTALYTIQYRWFQNVQTHSEIGYQRSDSNGCYCIVKCIQFGAHKSEFHDREGLIDTGSRALLCDSKLILVHSCAFAFVRQCWQQARRPHTQIQISYTAPTMEKASQSHSKCKKYIFRV